MAGRTAPFALRSHAHTHPRTAWQLHRSHCSWQITHCLHTYASWGALALDLDARTHARVHVCESGDIVHIFAHDSLRSSVCSCVCLAKRAMCEYVCAFVYWMCGAGAGACISTGTPRSPGKVRKYIQFVRRRVRVCALVGANKIGPKYCKRRGSRIILGTRTNRAHCHLVPFGMRT